jgi:putative two-component system response regulator
MATQARAPAGATPAAAAATEPARVLAIDDDADIRALISKVLGAHYRVKTAADGRAGLRAAMAAPAPDLILLDVSMPDTDGFEVCRMLKDNPATAQIPVLFLSGRAEMKDEMKGFAAGAVDYITKPIGPGVLQARVRTHLALAHRRHELERLVRERTAQLEHTRLQLIRRLSRAMEYHESPAVGNRVMRVAHYCALIARAAGARPEVVDLMLKAAPLYDVGKLAVPAAVLTRTGELDAEEWQLMRSHPEVGAAIIGMHDDPLLKLGRVLALTHHERWDGSGYPAGLKGEKIPWPGRVMAVADTFEAMTATQYRRPAIRLEHAASYIAERAGVLFDPAVVQALHKALPELRKVRQTYADRLGDLLDLDFTHR